MNNEWFSCMHGVVIVCVHKPQKRFFLAQGLKHVPSPTDTRIRTSKGQGRHPYLHFAFLSFHTFLLPHYSSTITATTTSLINNVGIRIQQQ